MLEVKRLIGDTEVRFVSDGKDLKEDILRVSWLTNAPIKCGICGDTNIILQARNTKDKEGEEYTYAEFKCLKCWASATLGEYKSPKGALFLKKWVAYEKTEQRENK